MGKFLNLEQRSPEWHAWRANRLGGSDVGAILGLNPWTSAQLLWERKTGRAPAQADNPAMARGRQLEDEALAAWSARTGEIAAPVCVEHADHEWAGASLDGMTLDGKLLVEIKCMGEKNHQKVLDTRVVPDYYYCQCQYQLACADTKVLHFWAYRPECENPEDRGVLIVVHRDDEYIAWMMERLEAFWQCVQEDIPPAGNDFTAAEKVLALAQARAKAAADHAKSAKKALMDLVPEGTEKQQGLLYTVTKVSREGSVDYQAMVKAILALDDLPEAVSDILANVEGFRKSGTTYWDVKERKAKKARA